MSVAYTHLDVYKRQLPEDRIIKKSSVEVVNNHAKTSPKQSYYWEIDVDPAENGAVEVTFGDNCTLRIDSALREMCIRDSHYHHGA